MIVYLLGFMGAGKSYLGKQLAEYTGSAFVDLDDVLSAKAGMTIKQVFEKHGEAYFRDLESTMLKEISDNYMADEEGVLNGAKKEYVFIGCGGGTPCFNNNMEWMNQHGITVWLNPPVNVLYARLKLEKEHRPLLNGLDDHQLLLFIENKLAERKIIYELSIVELSGNSQTISNILKTINDAQNFL